MRGEEEFEEDPKSASPQPQPYPNPSPSPNLGPLSSTQQLEPIASDSDQSGSLAGSGDSLPLLEVDINITPTHTERIQIYSGDVVGGEDGIARKFCREHELGEDMER